MDFKKFAVSTPIISVQRREKCDPLSSAKPHTVNDSGYFTPSPVVEKCSPADSQYEEDGGSSILSATPLTSGRPQGKSTQLSGYLTPSPILENGSPGDSQYGDDSGNGSSVFGLTPLTSGRPWELKLANNNNSVFTKLGVNFTPPIFPILEKCSPGDSQYLEGSVSESSILDATPLTSKKLQGFKLANDDNAVFTQLKAAFDDDQTQRSSTSASQKPNFTVRQFDRLHSNQLKLRKEHHYNSHQARLVFLHDIGTMNGESRVDFVKEFRDLNLSNITSLVMKFVDDSDLCAMCCANKQWNDAVKSDLVTRERRKKYLELCTREKENKLNDLNKKSKECTRKVSRSLLDDIINVNSNSSEDAKKAEHDPAESELKHYKQFLEAGRRLKPNEMLDKCPRCSSPAKVNSQQKRARCSLSGCEFDYCTLCRCEYNFRHHCSPVKLGSMRLSIPNKKRSKKFLRRLLT